MASAALKLELPPPDTLADLLRRLGDIPAERVLMHPPPGTATEQDLIDLLEAANKRLVELVDGVLVEKPMGFREAILAGVILQLIWNYLDEHDLGVAAGADGPIRFRLGLVYIPDVCFVSWKRLGGDEVPDDPVSKVIPELAVEVLSKSNTRREIERKLHQYFEAGVLLAWVIDPKKQTAEVYTSPVKKKQLTTAGVLDGGKVLPGFKLPLKDLFAKFRRRLRKR
jgi:Uma2 family endonuclease